MERPHRILVIDDDKNLCQSLKRNLEHAYRWHVSFALNGKDGLTLAKSQSPDLIFLDVMMPGMGGGEVAEALLESPLTKDIPIVFLTGMVDKAQVEECGGEIGGRRYLAKPTSLEEVAAMVRSVLGR